MFLLQTTLAAERNQEVWSQESGQGAYGRFDFVRCAKSGQRPGDRAFRCCYGHGREETWGSRVHRVPKVQSFTAVWRQTRAQVVPRFRPNNAITKAFGV